MTDRILVPVDGSPLSRRALETALEEHPDSGIVVLHVIDPSEPGYSVADAEYDHTTEPRHGSEAWYDRANELVDDLFDELTATAADHDGSIATERAIGRADREIIEYATHNDVDQIILGSHGRETGAHPLVGSVTEAVAFRAPMRVSLIR
ncbi:universal stress protein [Natrononativus amylolyticus]|uniref:universal stress protein n=1 Tax=Natrononativus amylolyticus TaxID=2963434 RepID=UPI0020CDB75C|nr:universal stress protein [Natrononativus amylolyticus]